MTHPHPDSASTMLDYVLKGDSAGLIGRCIPFNCLIGTQ